jgi:UDP-glucose 4-epimerase
MSHSTMSMSVLITGGAGYIGSHTSISLIKSGFTPIILDNFSNSSPSVVDCINNISNTKIQVIKGDIRDRNLLNEIFTRFSIDAVIHFAGSKSVSDSINSPISYYDNNVKGTIELIAAMEEAQVNTFVFSSSATIYGNPITNPILENFSRSANNPYGRTKLICEEILEDIYSRKPFWRIAKLRYFNPVGAHPSGLIGENPTGIPNNLMPYIAQVASGQRKFLSVYGGDYPTPDGTGIRDYIHIDDLAEGHVAALRSIALQGELLTVNLGTGFGASVLQMIKAFEKVSRRSIPYEIVSRRPGDVAECWADTSLAKRRMSWTAKKSIEEMCTDAWRWQEHLLKGNTNFFEPRKLSGEF